MVRALSRKCFLQGLEVREIDEFNGYNDLEENTVATRGRVKSYNVQPHSQRVSHMITSSFDNTITRTAF